MTTLIQIDEENFRPINISFLDEKRGQPFDIFYKTQLFGTVKYVKFAGSDPAHRARVRDLIESEDTTEEFFVREEDLFKYYEQATQTLRRIVGNPEVPFETKTRKIYTVSKGLMKEFFEYNASPKILRSSEEVMELMEDCLSSAQAGYYGISKITSKDYYTYTHSLNVGLYCMTYGVKVRMDRRTVQELGLGGMLHDVGKAKIASDIINKKGKLTREEFEEIKKHSTLGAEILETMNCYGMGVISMARSHHEKYEGGGYPEGLEGETISQHARICKIMDVYDALSTRRSYKKALSPYDTLTLMKKQMAHEFDPAILENFIRFMGPDL